MYFHNLKIDFIFAFPQKVLRFVSLMVEETHPCSEIAVQLLLIILDPNLRITHHQIVIIVHKWPTSLQITQIIEFRFVEIEQEGFFSLRVLLSL